MKRWLALLLAGAMAASVSACGSGDDFMEASTELNILMAEDYISDTLIADFEAANNCTVNLSYMNDAEDRTAALQNGEGEYDLVLTTDGYLQELIAEEKLEKISHDKLSNTSTINDTYWGSKSYCIPYLMNYVYIIYDTETCPIEITKYNDLLKPELKGKVAVLEDERGLFAMALATLGYAPNSVEDSEIEAAYNWLMKLNENVAVYGDGKEELLDGTVSVAVTYDRVAAEVMAQKKSVQIAPLTKDKVRVEVDLFVMVKDTPHKDLADAFLQYICDPEVMAANLEEYPYSCPNEVALALVSEEYHNRAERQFDYQERAYFKKDISEAEDTYEEFFQKWNETK